MSRNVWNLFRGIRLREVDKKVSLASVVPQLDVRFDAASLENLVREVRGFPGALEQAAFKATDKARFATRRALVSGLTDLVTLKPAFIKKTITTKKARGVGNGVQAEIRVAARRLPLSRYAVTPERPPQLKGVRVADRQRTSYKLRFSDAAHGDRPRENTASASALFVQGMGSGHIGVFYREKQADSIVQEWVPSIQYHLYADGFMDNIITLSCASFRAAFTAEVHLVRGVA